MRAEDDARLDRVEQLIDALESHPDAEVAAMAAEMLQGIDTVHRQGLTRLVEMIREMAGQPFINRLCEDASIRLLLMSYNLVPLDRRLVTEEALDVARERLQHRRVQIQLRDIVGGTVTIVAHGPPGSGDDDADIARVVEEALRQNLPGFQQLDIAPLPATGTTGDPVQLGGARLRS